MGIETSTVKMAAPTESRRIPCFITRRPFASEAAPTASTSPPK